MDFPNSVCLALERLEQNGYSAYLVGGCVRDYIMGISPNDYDITTNAKPIEIIKCFPDIKTLDIGIKHGTVTLVFEDMNIEVTTYRVDGEYKDNRRPESVSFTDDICEDLARRDFTINAIAYSPLLGFVDPFDGKGDIERHRIVCVGDAETRFMEDALRIMRALRFSSRFGFEIDNHTSNAVHSLKGLLKNIASERLRSELLGLIYGKYAFAVIEAYFDVLCEFVPGLNESTRQELSLRLSKAESCDEDVKLCVFFSVLDAVKAKEAMKGLKFDNKHIKTVNSVLTYLESGREFFGTVAVKKCVSVLSYDAVLFYKTLLCTSDGERVKDSCNEALWDVKRLSESGACLSLSQLAVKGNDILDYFKVKPSIVGKILSELLDDVIEEKCPNEKTALLKRAERYTQEDIQGE